jgi:hypothetical protein
MADLDASRGQHLLDHPKAEWKSEIQSDSMADDFGWEAVAGIARMAGRFHTIAYAQVQSLSR